MTSSSHCNLYKRANNRCWITTTNCNNSYPGRYLLILIILPQICVLIFIENMKIRLNPTQLENQFSMISILRILFIRVSLMTKKNVKCVIYKTYVGCTGVAFWHRMNSRDETNISPHLLALIQCRWMIFILLWMINCISNKRIHNISLFLFYCGYSLFRWFTWYIYPYFSGLHQVYWNFGNLMIGAVSVKNCWNLLVSYNKNA